MEHRRRSAGSSTADKQELYLAADRSLRGIDASMSPREKLRSAAKAVHVPIRARSTLDRGVEQRAAKIGGRHYSRHGRRRGPGGEERFKFFVVNASPDLPLVQHIGGDAGATYGDLQDSVKIVLSAADESRRWDEKAARYPLVARALRVAREQARATKLGLSPPPPTGGIEALKRQLGVEVQGTTPSDGGAPAEESKASSSRRGSQGGQPMRGRRPGPGGRGDGGRTGLRGSRRPTTGTTSTAGSDGAASSGRNPRPPTGGSNAAGGRAGVGANVGTRVGSGRRRARRIRAPVKAVTSKDIVRLGLWAGEGRQQQAGPSAIGRGSEGVGVEVPAGLELPAGRGARAGDDVRSGAIVPGHGRVEYDRKAATSRGSHRGTANQEIDEASSARATAGAGGPRSSGGLRQWQLPSRKRDSQQAVLAQGNLGLNTLGSDTRIGSFVPATESGHANANLAASTEPTYATVDGQFEPARIHGHAAGPIAEPATGPLVGRLLDSESGRGESTEWVGTTPGAAASAAEDAELVAPAPPLREAPVGNSVAVGSEASQGGSSSPSQAPVGRAGYSGPGDDAPEWQQTRVIADEEEVFMDRARWEVQAAGLMGLNTSAMRRRSKAHVHGKGSGTRRERSSTSRSSPDGGGRSGRRSPRHSRRASGATEEDQDEDGDGADDVSKMDAATWQAAEAARRRAAAEALAIRQHLSMYYSTDQLNRIDEVGMRAAKRVAGLSDGEDGSPEHGKRDESQGSGTGGVRWGLDGVASRTANVGPSQALAALAAASESHGPPRPGTVPNTGGSTRGIGRESRRRSIHRAAASPRGGNAGSDGSYAPAEWVAEHPATWGFAAGTGGKLFSVADSQARSRHVATAVAVAARRQREMEQSRLLARSVAMQRQRNGQAQEKTQAAGVVLSVPTDNVRAIQAAHKVMDPDAVERRRRQVDARTRQLRKEQAERRRAERRKAPVDLMASSLRAARGLEEGESGSEEEDEDDVDEDGHSAAGGRHGTVDARSKGGRSRSSRTAGGRRDSVEQRATLARKEKQKKDAEARLDGGAAKHVGVFRIYLRTPIVVYSERRPLVGEGFQDDDDDGEQVGVTVPGGARVGRFGSGQRRGLTSRGSLGRGGSVSPAASTLSPRPPTVASGRVPVSAMKRRVARIVRVARTRGAESVRVTSAIAEPGTTTHGTSSPQSAENRSDQSGLGDFVGIPDAPITDRSSNSVAGSPRETPPSGMGSHAGAGGARAPTPQQQQRRFDFGHPSSSSSTSIRRGGESSTLAGASTRSSRWPWQSPGQHSSHAHELRVVAPTSADQRIAKMRDTARDEILSLAVHKRHSAVRRRSSIAKMRGYVRMAAVRRSTPLESIALRDGEPVPDKRAAQEALAQAWYGHPKGVRASTASLANGSAVEQGGSQGSAGQVAQPLPTAAEEERERAIRNAARRAVEGGMRELRGWRAGQVYDGAFGGRA